MMCAWKELLAVLPPWLRQKVDALGREGSQELRLRMGAPPEMVTETGSLWLPGTVSREDLNFVVNAASRYSPWAAATAAKGYLTAPGGHRIGLCGEVVCKDGSVDGIRDLRSVCIRIARDYQGICKNLSIGSDSVLILGAPGWGKTTLLRELVRCMSEKESVSVVDERGELFPMGFPAGKRTDILSGCPKTAGIEMALRTMGPGCIAVDEITAEEDCQALVQAANCGVRLLATAHAASVRDFHTRRIYQILTELKVFQTLLILRQDKSYVTERIAL